jgi:hypothetical protein
MNKIGLSASPEIGMHETIAVPDCDDEYANPGLRHNISY